jgi:hypothetical protein
MVEKATSASREHILEQALVEARVEIQGLQDRLESQEETYRQREEEIFQNTEMIVRGMSSRMSRKISNLFFFFVAAIGTAYLILL